MDALRKLYPYLRPYRRSYLFAMLGITVLTFLTTVPPLILRHLIDNVVTPGRWEMLLPWVAAFAFTPVLVAAIRFVSITILMSASQRFLADLRVAMYERILNLQMRFHTKYAGGMLVSRLISDINMLQQLLTGETVRLLVDGIIFLVAAVAIFYLNTTLGLIFLGMIALYILAARYFTRRIRSATQAYRFIHDRIAGRLQETVEGVRQVRIYNREDWENELFADRTLDSLDHNHSGRKSAVNLSISLSAIAGYGSTLIYCLAAYYIIYGKMQMGILLAINMFVWMAIQPAMRLANMSGQLAESFVSVRRIVEVLDEPYSFDHNENGPRIPCGEGRVEFRDVHFSYEPSSPLYRGLNLTVEPGQTVALVGHTGCGKTTLTQLLMRYWEVDDGEILIDGTDIRTVQLHSLRKLFGVVLQDPVVFEGTIAENIAYGVPNATREEIEDAARTAELYETIVGYENGFDTMLGSEGVRLSMGQKQRLSIARAILRDPVILIMDEATSSLDSESEALIQKALARVLEGRTSFVVAHRLSTITSADLIVVMDAGAIVEQGTHDELMARDGGLYQRYYEELRHGLGEDEA